MHAEVAFGMSLRSQIRDLKLGSKGYLPSDDHSMGSRERFRSRMADQLRLEKELPTSTQRISGRTHQVTTFTPSSGSVSEARVRRPSSEYASRFSAADPNTLTSGSRRRSLSGGERTPPPILRRRLDRQERPGRPLVPAAREKAKPDPVEENRRVATRMLPSRPQTALARTRLGLSSTLNSSTMNVTSRAKSLRSRIDDISMRNETSSFGGSILPFLDEHSLLGLEQALGALRRSPSLPAIRPTEARLGSPIFKSRRPSSASEIGLNHLSRSIRELQGSPSPSGEFSPALFQRKEQARQEVERKQRETQKKFKGADEGAVTALESVVIARSSVSTLTELIKAKEADLERRSNQFSEDERLLADKQREALELEFKLKQLAYLKQLEEEEEEMIRKMEAANSEKEALTERIRNQSVLIEQLVGVSATPSPPAPSRTVEIFSIGTPLNERPDSPLDRSSPLCPLAEIPEHQSTPLFEIGSDIELNDLPGWSSPLRPELSGITEVEEPEFDSLPGYRSIRPKFDKADVLPEQGVVDREEAIHRACGSETSVTAKSPGIVSSPVKEQAVSFEFQVVGQSPLSVFQESPLPKLVDFKKSPQRSPDRIVESSFSFRNVGKGPVCGLPDIREFEAISPPNMESPAVAHNFTPEEGEIPIHESEPQIVQELIQQSPGEEAEFWRDSVSPILVEPEVEDVHREVRMEAPERMGTVISLADELNIGIDDNEEVVDEIVSIENQRDEEEVVVVPVEGIQAVSPVVEAVCELVGEEHVVPATAEVDRITDSLIDDLLAEVLSEVSTAASPAPVAKQWKLPTRVDSFDLPVAGVVEPAGGNNIDVQAVISEITGFVLNDLGFLDASAVGSELTTQQMNKIRIMDLFPLVRKHVHSDAIAQCIADSFVWLIDSLPPAAAADRAWTIRCPGARNPLSAFLPKSHSLQSLCSELSSLIVDHNREFPDPMEKVDIVCRDFIKKFCLDDARFFCIGTRDEEEENAQLEMEIMAEVTGFIEEALLSSVLCDFEFSNTIKS